VRKLLKVRVLKHSFDFIFALTIAIVLMPFLALLALLLWALHAESPFYTQKRVGRRGQIFTIIKFKTQGKRIDYHKSKVLNYLRTTHIDEVPQLFNVITGSMSLVGPRPHIPEHVQLYEEWQKKRLIMKPGITCLRQLNNPGIKLNFNTLIEDDIFYVENWTLARDIKILINTLRVLPKLLSKL
jgi:undecaprenyl phosphate N,N'-diacetylbacillosamine 1-phosphate transferase